MTCVATSKAGAADGLDVDFNRDNFSRPCSNSCVFFIMKNKSIKEMNKDIYSPVTLRSVQELVLVTFHSYVYTHQ